MVTEPLAVSIEDARRHLGGISIATIYRMFDRHQLEKKKIGGRTLVSMSSIRALLEAA